MNHCPVIVLGAGAAGLMCALTAARRGREVLVLDHANRPGKKILMSGGGHCNFTNRQVEPEHYLSANPHFCKSALSRFRPQDFIDLVEAHGIEYQEKRHGQLFCVGKSREILDLLLGECREAGVHIETRCPIQRVEHDAGFILHTSLGSFSADSLVVATGGLSIPTLGASDFGYRLARQFGIPLTPHAPGLSPLVMDKRQWRDFAGLSGIGLSASVRCGGQLFEEAILFTHRGLSGPAILQISNYWRPGDELEIDLLPGEDLRQTLEDWRQRRPDAELKTLLARRLPKRLARLWAERSLPNRPLRQYSPREREAIAQAIHHWRIRPAGYEGYGVAEVTRGGVDTRAISSRSFESRQVPGLYFVGEVLDVTGWLGGFNFQWAWASGFCAGQVV